MHPSHIMTQRETIRINLNKSDWEIRTDKCDSKCAHRRHLAANGKHENKWKIYCTNVHLRIIEILITLMYKLSAVTAAVTPSCVLVLRNAWEITVEERPLAFQMCLHGYGNGPETRPENGSFSPQNGPLRGTTAWYTPY